MNLFLQMQLCVVIVLRRDEVAGRLAKEDEREVGELGDGAGILLERQESASLVGRIGRQC